MRPHNTFYSENISLIEIYRIYTGYRVLYIQTAHFVGQTSYGCNDIYTILCRDVQATFLK